MSSNIYNTLMANPNKLLYILSLASNDLIASPNFFFLFDSLEFFISEPCQVSGVRYFVSSSLVSFFQVISNRP